MTKITKTFHIVTDESNGKFEWYYNNNILKQHTYIKNGDEHGELKRYNYKGILQEHEFHQYGKDITEDIKKIVSDIANITNEEKVIIKLKFDIDQYLLKGDI